MKKEAKLEVDEKHVVHSTCIGVRDCDSDHFPIFQIVEVRLPGSDPSRKHYISSSMFWPQTFVSKMIATTDICVGNFMSRCPNGLVIRKEEILSCCW